MNETRVTFHPNYQIGKIDRRLFSAYLEPVYGFVYGGIWDPRHKTADDLGFRQDIMEQTRELGYLAVRLPGGNITSGWEWKDSIGPKEQRKAHLDLAWRQFETNEVGHDEYLEWARRVGTDPIYTLNLGTGTVQDALHCVEYSRIEGGTYWSDLRRQNGYEKPHQVKTWCLGNELDGPWQIHSFEKDPKEYGIKALETSKVVKWIDPEAETVVCGSSNPNNRTCPDWDLQVLRECYEMVDYLSLHYYHNAPAGDFATYLSASTALENFLNMEISMCDVVQALDNSNRKVMIAFDEYGCMFSPQKETTKGRKGTIEHSSYNEFSDANLNHPFTHYDLDHPQMVDMGPSDILTMVSQMSMLLTLMRHADRVKIGCMSSGLLNIGHDAEHVWKNVGYYPMEMLIKYAKGVSLLPSLEGPGFSSEGCNLDDFNQVSPYQNISYIVTAASMDIQNGEMAIFLVNMNWEGDSPVEIDVSDFIGYSFEQHVELFSEDLYAKNTAENTECVKPIINKNTYMKDGKIYADLKKLSFNMIRLSSKDR